MYFKKNILDKIKKDPYVLWEWVLRFSGITSLSDYAFIKTYWRRNMGNTLNLKNPKTFNEKLQWLKLNDRNPLYTTMVDKYAAKDYVTKKIGSEYIIPTIGLWNSTKDINKDNLPDKFVLKCTHDSGCIEICKNKDSFDFEKSYKRLEQSLKKNYYRPFREWPYKNVPPKILAEELLEIKIDGKTSENSPNDYKLYCFNGKVKLIKVDFDRQSSHGANFFDINFNLLKFGLDKYPPNFNKNLEKPKNLDKMIELAEILAEDIPFIRVDFYNIDGKIYFGELTFYPDAGFVNFLPKEWDVTLGNYLNLPI